MPVRMADAFNLIITLQSVTGKKPSQRHNTINRKELGFFVINDHTHICNEHMMGLQST